MPGPKPLNMSPSRAAHARSFHTDPSGTFVRYQAKAIGSGSEGAQTALQEGYRKDMTLKEAEELTLATLKQVMEEKASGGLGASPVCDCLRWVGGCRAWGYWAHLPRPAAGPSECVGPLPARPLSWDHRNQGFGVTEPGRAHPAPVVQVTSTNVDIARVAPTWHLYSPEEVEEVFVRL